MMGFRDMTFCHSPCANHKCRRKLTMDVVEAARKWWGGKDAPIAMADFADLCPDHQIEETESDND